VEAVKTIYTIREAAKRTGTPEFALRNWCKRGDVRHVKSGNRVYLTIEAIEEFLTKGGAGQNEPRHITSK
jgi:excisionase family DNA binding protein